MAADPRLVQAAIRKEIDDDPTIKEADKIVVEVEKTGGVFGKSRVVLTGKVTSVHDKKRVEEIARSRSSTLPVESRILL